MLSIKQISTRKWLPEYDDFTKIALDCRKISYSPYSKFTVGCCLLCENGNIYKGCNIENAAYGVVNCAERTALYSALSNGEKKFSMITIVGNDSNTKNSIFCYPCGICRQALSEFVDNDKFYILLPKTDKNEKVIDFQIFTLEELLPYSFTIDTKSLQ